MSGGELARALADTLFEITAIPSPIGEEKALCDHVQARLSRTLGADSVIRFRDSLVVRANIKPGAPKIALVGHLDVVRTRNGLFGGIDPLIQHRTHQRGEQADDDQHDEQFG